MQLTMRKFDVKKNCFLRKDLVGPVGKQNPLLPGRSLKYLNRISNLSKLSITLLSLYKTALLATVALVEK